MLGQDNAREAPEKHPASQCHSSSGCASRWALLSVFDLTSRPLGFRSSTLITMRQCGIR